ncbi:hypothetical protein OG689_13785 [Kitasatospora sp. NBC_00240]|uniref:hypothetical protein n=1 Tax=Kitasatospora sp. NBC_00240 TaxID=2903567 RepID=UPI0022574B3B|nr:hypothetical protein [Kitasatospora sp. NBC_00240]MCX5210349.1 hypothetical protein [Kitasatospora sp. NBC_00240]
MSRTPPPGAKGPSRPGGGRGTRGPSRGPAGPTAPPFPDGPAIGEPDGGHIVRRPAPGTDSSAEGDGGEPEQA